MSKGNGQADIPTAEERQTEAQADSRENLLDEKGANEAAPDTPASAVVDRPQAVENEVEKLRAERDVLFDRLARLQAEFDNYRKRASKESADFRDFAVSHAVNLLLPVVDNFALALKNAGSNPEEFKKGVELIEKQLQDVLQRLNVQRVSAHGQPFDPRTHEAVEVVETGDVADNHVLEELRPGYKIKDRLLRPAMVRVAKNPKSVN